MKYVNKGNLVALLFVSAFAGDVALAEGLETKRGSDEMTIEMAAEVRADLELTRDNFYQEFENAGQKQELADAGKTRKWKNSIYFPVVPEATTVAHRL